MSYVNLVGFTGVRFMIIFCSRQESVASGGERSIQLSYKRIIEPVL
jgi:hypothetical protein